MVAKRIIPCLDVADGRVVKGVNFVGLRDAGDNVRIAVVIGIVWIIDGRLFSFAESCQGAHMIDYELAGGLWSDSSVNPAVVFNPFIWKAVE